MYYNIHVAASVTTQGRSLVSTLGMFFEQFLANNVKFGSINEVVTFIHNVITEERSYNDSDILSHDISREDCFSKIMMTCGFEWIPEEEDMDAIWDLIKNLPQKDINRLYYKNNLYEFVIQNEKIINLIKVMLRKMNTPFLNPNKCPDEIKEELNLFCSILSEYVFYNYHYIDRIDRMDNMIKSVTALSDTDSTIVSFDAWYNCILDLVKDEKDINILRYSIDLASYVENYDSINLVSIIPEERSWDFFNEDVIEHQRKINLGEVIPQDNLRYSIINIIAYCASNMLVDYFSGYCERSNSYNGDCLIIAKNEFLFKTALLTNHKKNYATLQEIQEGNMIPKNKQIDEKGLAISKSSMNKNTRDTLEEILQRDILDASNIDRVDILSKLALLEHNINESLRAGRRDYYKPVVIKGFESYEDPFKIQGIKAALAWNELRGDQEMIDLRERNAIDIVKVNITLETAEKVKYKYPDLYQRIVSALSPISKLKDAFKGCIKSLGLPKDIDVPEWVSEFINYTDIVNDNIKNFPLESIGIMRQEKKAVNYTNIIKI